MADWSDLKGLAVPEASAKAAQYDFVIHVARHGDMFADPHTSYVENRINVAVSTDPEPVVTGILGRG